MSLDGDRLVSVQCKPGSCKPVNHANAAMRACEKDGPCGLLSSMGEVVWKGPITINGKPMAEALGGG